MAAAPCFHAGMRTSYCTLNAVLGCHLALTAVLQLTFYDLNAASPVLHFCAGRRTSYWTLGAVLGCHLALTAALHVRRAVLESSGQLPAGGSGDRVPGKGVGLAPSSAAVRVRNLVRTAAVSSGLSCSDVEQQLSHP